MLLASGAINAGQDIWSRGKGLWGQILWLLGQSGAGHLCIPHPVARHCCHTSRSPLGRGEGAEHQGSGLGHTGDGSKGRCQGIPGTGCALSTADRQAPVRAQQLIHVSAGPS